MDHFVVTAVDELTEDWRTYHTDSGRNRLQCNCGTTEQ